MNSESAARKVRLHSRNARPRSLFGAEYLAIDMKIAGRAGVLESALMLVWLSDDDERNLARDPGWAGRFGVLSDVVSAKSCRSVQAAGAITIKQFRKGVTDGSSEERALAEFMGTFWLVLVDVAARCLSAAFPDVGIGLAGVSLAFGLTVLTMAYAIGHISGCHLNPAVSVGLWAGGRFPASQLLPYIIAQVLAAVVAAWIPVSHCLRQGRVRSGGGLASNGYGGFRPVAIHCIQD